MRSPFVQDYDRIIFSSSFRRLAKKTQVHPLVRNDHIHNRLTHSLEVSSVGRSLALLAGQGLVERGCLPQEYSPEHLGQIMQAACLAHDIGNPPFGHAGEEAIRDWFKDAGHAKHYLKDLRPAERADFEAFDGNAQGFRVVNTLENNKDTGGFRLTFPVLASLVKYPCSAHEALGRSSSKFNYYTAEQEIFTDVFSTLGLVHDGRARRHPLSYLLEAADDICYRIIDMEDACELRIITYQDIKDVMAPLLSDSDMDCERLAGMDSDRRRSGMLRTRAMGCIIPSVAQTFLDNYEDIMAGKLQGDAWQLVQSGLCVCWLNEGRQDAALQLLGKLDPHHRGVALSNLLRHLIEAGEERQVLELLEVERLDLVAVEHPPLEEVEHAGRGILARAGGADQLGLALGDELVHQRRGGVVEQVDVVDDQQQRALAYALHKRA